MTFFIFSYTSSLTRTQKPSYSGKIVPPSPAPGARGQTPGKGMNVPETVMPIGQGNDLPGMTEYDAEELLHGQARLSPARLSGRELAAPCWVGVRVLVGSM